LEGVISISEVNRHRPLYAGGPFLAAGNWIARTSRAMTNIKKGNAGRIIEGGKKLLAPHSPSV
jgi:hypothetical protein